MLESAGPPYRHVAESFRGGLPDERDSLTVHFLGPHVTHKRSLSCLPEDLPFEAQCRVNG